MARGRTGKVLEVLYRRGDGGEEVRYRGPAGHPEAVRMMELVVREEGRHRRAGRPSPYRFRVAQGEGTAR